MRAGSAPGNRAARVAPGRQQVWSRPGEARALPKSLLGLGTHRRGHTRSEVPPRVREARFQTSVLKSFLPLWTSWKTTALICIFLHIPVAADVWKSGNLAQILTGKGKTRSHGCPPRMCPIPLTLIFIFFPGFSIC